MSEFEFVFPLFALLVGLAVTEMLAGLAHALKSKRDIHVGWLTPLLGTLILINLAMFWQGSWEMREGFTASSSSFLLVLAVGGTYFLAASLTFPSWDANVRDLDQHFMDNRKLAILAIAACNTVYFVRVAMVTNQVIDVWWWAGNASFLALLLIAALARRRWMILTALWVLILAHVLLLIIR